MFPEGAKERGKVTSMVGLKSPKIRVWGASMVYSLNLTNIWGREGKKWGKLPDSPKEVRDFECLLRRRCNFSRLPTVERRSLPDSRWTSFSAFLNSRSPFWCTHRDFAMGCYEPIGFFDYETTNIPQNSHIFTQIPHKFYRIRKNSKV